MKNKGLEREAWLINNPALGSYLLWTFSIECFMKKKQAIHPSKIFCLFPFIYYSDTREVLCQTQLSSNLRAYIMKFSKANLCATDIALSIHPRVYEQKEKTLESLIIAFDTGLLTIDKESGMITPNTKIKEIPRTKLNDSIRELYESSRKLGRWLSDMNTDDIKRTIKVVF